MAPQSTCTRLKGKIACVTAATLGIGYSIAERFLLEGATVVICSRKQKNVDEACSTLKKSVNGGAVLGVKAHVGLSEDRAALFDFIQSKFGKLDILVSNAAVNPVFCGITEVQEDAWDKIFDVNVKAAFLLTKLFLPLMESSVRQGGHPAILFVGSVSGYAPFQGLGVYSISKTALHALGRTLARELASSHIRVNVLAPGIVKTKFSSALWKSEQAEQQSEEERERAAQAGVAMLRMAEPEEMGGPAAFACSDDAQYMTGEILVISGGMQCRF